MSASLVKELRERTGLGLLECKKALAAVGGDVQLAIEELRKSSGMKAAKKASRTAADGVVATRVADDCSFGVLVEVNSETDFVARDENFLGFVRRVVDAVFSSKQTDVAALMSGELEAAREALRLPQLLVEQARKATAGIDALLEQIAPAQALQT